MCFGAHMSGDDKQTLVWHQALVLTVTEGVGEGRGARGLGRTWLSEKEGLHQTSLLGSLGVRQLSQDGSSQLWELQAPRRRTGKQMCG